MLGYFLASINNKINVLVTVEILSNSFNDIHRTNIINSETAVYVGDNLKIIKIVDEVKNEYEYFKVKYDKNNYKLNDIITYKFYLTKSRAVGSHIPHQKFTGKITKWYPTGVIEKITSYVDGWKDGSCNEFWSSGKIKLIIEYKKGCINNTYKKFNEEGKICEIGSYTNGKLNYRKRFKDEDMYFITDSEFL
jgi:antitoxin component YwqK of YwqJK toxin-antitoxin module